MNKKQVEWRFPKQHALTVLKKLKDKVKAEKSPVLDSTDTAYNEGIDIAIGLINEMIGEQDEAKA